jgi:GDP-mannose 6-dehydrogenase
MRISVFGLGYVGAVTAGHLARRGHTIIGVDVQTQKVEAFNRGEAPIVEPGLAELLQSAKENGLLRATESCAEAVAETDLSLVCVGTPSTVTGALDLQYVRRVTEQIAAALLRKRAPHTLVFRSTMLPGSTARLVGDFLSGPLSPAAASTFYYPEFMREGSALADCERPSLAVVGTVDGCLPPAGLMAQLFGEQAAVVTWHTAEMVKYACNAFHALKITFANEIGRLGKHIGVDAVSVMELLCRDTKLNISTSYLRPGNPFGGSCLPKDLNALTNHARQEGLHLPVLEHLVASNDRHLQSILRLVLGSDVDEVVILGLAFKENTDDLRESAMVEVAQVLLGRGYKIRIYDPALNLGAIVGANRRVIDTRMPHLASLLRGDLGAALGERGLIVAAQRCVTLEELRRAVTPQHRLLDVNGWRELQQLPIPYTGLCW